MVVPIRESPVDVGKPDRGLAERFRHEESVQNKGYVARRPRETRAIETCADGGGKFGPGLGLSHL
jgi:hypothetical protein